MAYDSFLEKHLDNFGDKKAEPFKKADDDPETTISGGDPGRIQAKKGSGDFTDCMDRIVPAANPDDPEAFCADYEHRQTGSWPGEKRASIHRDTFLDGPVSKIGWTDEARAAAAAARAHGYSSTNPGPKGSSGDLGDSVMAHPSGNKVTIKPDGSWEHQSPVRSADVSDKGAENLNTHLNQIHGPETNYAAQAEEERQRQDAQRKPFINPARVTPTGPYHTTGVQPA